MGVAQFSVQAESWQGCTADGYARTGYNGQSDATRKFFKALQIIENDEVMTKRRPPTAGTFARLAMISAAACACLPELVDLTNVAWRQPSKDAVPTSRLPGPRVMGSLHTAADAEIAVDRFRFAAGTPFLDAEAAPPMSSARRLEPAEFALDLPPDRIISETDATARVPDVPKLPDQRREQPETSPAISPVVAERAPAETDAGAGSQPDSGRGPVASAEDGKPAPAAAVATPAPPSLPQSVAPVTKPAVGPAGAEDLAAKAQPPLVGKRVEPKPAAEQPSSKRQAEPSQPPKRATASGTQSGKQKSAATDDVGPAPAPKAKWRPENVNNWPD